MCRWETSGEAAEGELPVSVSGFAERRLKLSSLSSESLSALTAGWTSFLKTRSGQSTDPFYMSIAHRQSYFNALNVLFRGKRGEEEKKNLIRQITCTNSLELSPFLSTTNYLFIDSQSDIMLFF